MLDSEDAKLLVIPTDLCAILRIVMVKDLRSKGGGTGLLVVGFFWNLAQIY